MHGLKRLLVKFRRDEGGAFLALFGLMSIVLVATSGAVVDFVSVQNARNDAQFALDAAALALQPSIYEESEDNLRSRAEELLLERMRAGNVAVEVERAVKNEADGSLFLEARLDVPMAFVRLVGYQQMTARVASEATRKQLFLEVAFVLDNSGSMSQSAGGGVSKMDALQDAASCATNIIFYDEVSDETCEPPGGAERSENVRASIVPFTTFVNVGAGNRNAPWIDGTGNSSIANDNFDDDNDESTQMTAAVNRFDLYDEIDNVSWQGCVEARPYPFSVDDTAPDAADPDTLFVPVFQPDAPDSGFNANYISDSAPQCNDEISGSCACEAWRNSRRGSYQFSCTFDPHGPGETVTSSDACWCGNWQYQGDDWPRRDVYTSYCSDVTVSSVNQLSDRERQERLCKYDGVSASFWNSRYGPNSDCPTNQLLSLTDNPDTVLSNISAMYPQGNTNIQQGTIWGYRTLTPAEPFTGGREPDSAVSKVMIVMTDGINTYSSTNNMNGSDFLGAYGHVYNAPVTGGTAYEPSDTRLGYTITHRNQLPNVMNTLTLESCQNAKNSGIQIYTIGLNPGDTATEEMLEDCASGAGNAYLPTTTDELQDVFRDIANQLSALRLAR